MRKSFSKFFNYIRPGSFQPAYKAAYRGLLGAAFSAFSLSYLLYNQKTTLNYYDPANPYGIEELFETEIILASNVEEGELKEVKVGPNETDTVLVTKFIGRYYVMASRCPYGGESLADGILMGEKIVCHRHNAGMSIATGKVDHGPILDRLAVFQTTVKNGKVYASLPKKLYHSKEVNKLKGPAVDLRTYVIVGGGAAGLSTAETLRHCGFTGEVFIITDEPNLPYDRAELSKNLDVSVDDVTFRKEENLKKHKIEIIRNKVKSIDFYRRSVILEGHDPIKYDAVVAATGSTAIVPDIPGNKLKNVYTLRTFDDKEKIKQAVEKARNVVLVGGSFITMEMAATIKQKYKDVNVTVVTRKAHPFEKRYGPNVGAGFQKILEDMGIKFKTNTTVESIAGGAQVSSVRLKAENVPADVVILGCGSKPNSDLFARISYLCDEGSINTDLFMAVSDDIYAAGDVCNFNYWYSGERVRTDHLSSAITQGRYVAYNILGKKIAYNEIPFYWSKLGDSCFEFIGVDKGYDKIHIDGDVASKNFVAYYAKGDLIIGAATMGRRNASMIIGQAMKGGLMPSFTQVKEGKVSVDDIKQKVLKNKKKNRCVNDLCQNKEAPYVR